MNILSDQNSLLIEKISYLKTLELETTISFRKDIEFLEKQISSIQELLTQSLLTLFDQMTEKLQEIFLEAYSTLNFYELSMTKLAEKIAKKLSLSFSTTKWNLMKLKEMELLELIGDRGNRRTKIEITQIGFCLYEILLNETKNSKQNKKKKIKRNH